MTTEREIVERAADALRREDGGLHTMEERHKMVLAVIRALAEAGCTEAMHYASEHLSNYTPENHLRAMLTALADRAEQQP